jgi:hypothetical protein
MDKQLTGMLVSVCYVMMYCLISFISAQSSQGSYTYHFDVFTSNGEYYDEPGMNMYAVVSGGAGAVDFTFYNESLFQSSIAGIYFDNGTLGDISAIINGPGTYFVEAFQGDKNLPAEMTLVPRFQTDITIRAAAVTFHNGINSLMTGEWVRMSFDLPADATLDTIAGELNSGLMRIGLHIIGLPDGSSESAILTPEPATLITLTVGAIALIRRKK